MQLNPRIPKILYYDFIYNISCTTVLNAAGGSRAHATEFIKSIVVSITCETQNTFTLLGFCIGYKQVASFLGVSVLFLGKR